jgi:dihydrofolate synthase/folylpolyglutamate synthase
MVPPTLRLLALPRFGAETGLHRMAALLDALPASLPHPTPEAVKITGSNGKGAVAAMTEAILRAAGVATGLYVSPHLFRVEERIGLGGEPISPETLDAGAAWALEAVAAYEAAHPEDRVGVFEALTAAAVHAFRGRGLEVVAAEAGIGGRFDPVRVFPGRLAALTSLDLEHTALLGGTLEAIAEDKADLCPDGGVLVLGAVPGEIRRRLRGALSLRGVRVLAVEDEAAVERVTLASEGTRMDLELAGGPSLPGLEMPLVGRHQAGNAAVSAVLAREWLRLRRPEISPAEQGEAIRRGLAAVRWPGRFERRPPRRPGEAELFADVGHTPAALAALAATVEQALAGRPVVLLAGVSAGRDPGALLAPVASLAAAVVCARSRHRGLAAADVAAAVRRGHAGLPAQVAPGNGEDLEAALERALERAAALGPGAVVLAAGSYFLAAEVLWIHRGGDPEDLTFF